MEFSINTTRNIKTTFSNVDDLVFFLVLLLLLLVLLFGEVIGLVTIGDVCDNVGESGTDDGEKEDSSSTIIAFLGVSILLYHIRCVHSMVDVS